MKQSQTSQILAQMHMHVGNGTKQKWKLMDKIQADLSVPRPTIRRVISEERKRISDLPENERTAAERRLIRVIREKSKTPTSKDKIRQIRQVLKSGDTTHVMIQQIGEIVNV